MPITQQERLGQVLLVFSYRSVTELLNLCENLTGLSELSVWGENQSVVWHVINQLQVICGINVCVSMCMNHSGFWPDVTGTTHLYQRIRFV